MKIDLVITELDVGGAELCFTNLALYLQRQGNDVRVLALGPPPDKDRFQLAERILTENIPLHFLNGARVWQAPQVVHQLRSLVRKRPPDLAQSFLYHANVVSSIVYPFGKHP